MTFREQLDCPLCHRGTVEVLVYGPELPYDTIAWSIQGVSQVDGCDHAELIDYRLMSGDIDLYDDIAIALAL
jgi:hypothetical protein